MINTKKVQGRRSVHYASIDEFLIEAKKLAECEVRALGNWSQGQIYEHLARALETSVDGVDFSIPAPMRWMVTLLMKKKFLYKEIPPGFKVSGKVLPEETTVADGLASLEKAVARQNSEARRAPHPAFGAISNEEWNAFNLRHAEMHMSFLIPQA